MINRLYAGDTLAFGVNVPDYPPAQGWTLKMRFTPRFTTPTQTPIVLTATPGPVDVGGETFDYAIAVEPAVTADWKAGAYGWASWVEKSGARQVLEEARYAGELSVLADPATAGAGTDMRSPARRALDDARAARADYLAGGRGGVAEYSIGDRRMKFRDAGDFVALISRLEIEVSREQRATELAAGRPDPRKTYVRATRG